MKQVPSFKETLKSIWANVPGVGFAKDKKEQVPVVKKKEKIVERVEIKAPPKVKLPPPEKPKKIKKTNRQPTIPLNPGEIYSDKAAEILGVPVAKFLEVVLVRARIPTRRVTKRYIMREKDVYALWDLMCDAKGVPRGTKLGDMQFMWKLPRKERAKLNIDDDGYSNHLQI